MLTDNDASRLAGLLEDRIRYSAGCLAHAIVKQSDMDAASDDMAACIRDALADFNEIYQEPYPRQILARQSVTAETN